MIGKCFGLLAIALIAACPTSSEAGLFGKLNCFQSSYRCAPVQCCRPCPPCPCPPPVCLAADCVCNSTDKVLDVTVIHGGGTVVRKCLRPGACFKFTFDPAKYNSAVIVAYEHGTNNLVSNEEWALIKNPPCPWGCIQITCCAPASADGQRAIRHREGVTVPQPATP